MILVQSSKAGYILLASPSLPHNPCLMICLASYDLHKTSLKEFPVVVVRTLWPKEMFEKACSSTRRVVVLMFLLPSLSWLLSFERRTSTFGNGLFALLSGDFKQIFEQFVSISVKTLSNTNLEASRHIKRHKDSLPVVHHSKPSPRYLTEIFPSRVGLIIGLH